MNIPKSFVTGCRLAVLLMASSAATSLLAQSSWNWNGSVSGNWTDGGNWTLNTSGGSSVPQGYLNFPSGTPGYFSNTNNFAAGSSGFQIYFNSGAGSFTLWGNSLTMYDWGGTAPVIENDSVNLQTVNIPLVFQPAAANLYARLEPSGGNLIIGSTLTMNNNNGTCQYRVTAGSGNTLTLNGALGEANGTGASFALNANDTVVFGAVNTYAGDTFVNNGTLRLSVNNGLPSSFVRLGDNSGVAGANLNLDGGFGLSTGINVRSGSSGGKIIANTASTTGTATYSGGLYLDAGATVYANSGGSVALSGGTIDLKAQTLTVDGPGNTTISGNLTNSTGSGALVKNGTGTLTLSGSNSFTGGITISAGNLSFSLATNLGVSGVSIGSAGTLNYAGSVNNTVTTNISGTGAINVAGTANSLILQGSNSFSGTITNALSTSSLVFDNINAAAGNPALVLNGGTMYLGNAFVGNSATFSSLSGSGNINMAYGATTGTRTVTINQAGSTTYSGVMSDASSRLAALSKSGAGTLAISVNQTYTGGTTVNNGILDLTGGGGSSGTIRGTATVNTGGTLRFSVGDAIGYGGGASSMTPINLTGGTLNVNTTANETFGSTTINMTGGSITGVTGGNLDFFGGSSALNTLASSTVSTISGVPISPLRQGSTTFTVASGTTTTNIDLDISSVIRTSPSGDAAGAVLIKAGTGTMRLSAVNTFAKPITVSAGELVGASGGSCANSVITVNNGATNGVQLLATAGQWTCAGLTIPPGAYACGDFNFNSFTPSSTTAPLQVNGGLIFSGQYGIIVRNTTLAVGQYPLIKYTGTLSGAQPTFPISVPGGVVSYISNNVVNKSLDLVVTSLSSPTSTYWSVTSGTWDINSTFNWTNAGGTSVKYQEGNAVVFNTPSSASTVTLNTVVNPAAQSNGVTFNSTQNYTVSGSGAIAGGAGVTKSGSGDLILATTNSFSGGIILNAGTLRASTSDAALGTGPLSVAASATLATASGGGARTLANPVVVATGQTLSVNAANANLTLNGPINGGGSLTSASTGTTTLGGVNTITNALAVNGGGTLVLATGSATTNLIGGIAVSTSGSGNTLTIQSGAALTGLYLRTGDNGSGNNSIVNQNGGTVTLTTASSSDIRLGHWATTGNYYNLLGGTLNVPNTFFNNGWDGASTFTIGGGTANLLGLAMIGSGAGGGGNPSTVVLTNGALNIGASGIYYNSGKTGTKTIYLGGGTLGASASWSTVAPIILTGTNGNVTVNPGANTITLGGGLSGAGGLTNTSGTLKFTGTNTYTGPTVITAGTVQLTSPGYAIVSGAVSGAGTLANISGVLDIGGAGNVAALSVASPFSSAGGNWVYDLFNPAAADLIAMTGSPAVTLTGTTTITPVNGIVTNGTYTLVNGAGTITGTAANLALGATSNLRGTPAASFTVSSPTISMIVSGVTSTNLIWQGTASSIWDINTTANWTNSPGATSDKFFNNDVVTFNDTALVTPAGTNVNVSATVYPAAVIVNNSSKIFGLGGAGSIAGAGSLTKSGTAMLIISNANNYAGGTIVNGGTLQLATNNPNGLGLGPLTMTGGTLDVNSNNLSVLTLSGTAGTITDGYNSGGAAVTRTLTVNQAVSNTFAGTLNNGAADTLALVKNGAGYLLLTGASTYGKAGSGATVNAGTLEATAKATTGNYQGDYTVAQGATLKLGYSTTTSFNYGNGVVLNGNGVSDPAGLYLLGGKTLGFGDTITIQTAPTTIRAYGSGTTTIAGGDVNNIHLNVAAAASGSVIDPAVNISCTSYGYRMTVAAGVNTANGDLLIGGVISGSGANGNGGPYNTNLRKEGTGSVLITNACTYANGVYVSAGSVILAGGNNRLPSTSGVILNSGTVLQLNGISQTVSDLSVNGTGGSVVGGSATTSTLTINNAAADTNNCTIGGTGLNQNNLALVKSGTGLLMLSGNLTYTNNTTISAGTVLAGALTNADGATLSVVDVAGTLAATNLTLGASGGSTVAITGFAGATSAPIVATNLVANGVTTITLAGTFTSGQFPLIQYLSGTKGGTGSFTVQQVGLPRGVSASIVTNSSNKSIDLLLTAYPLVWMGATNGVNVATWDNGVTTNWSLIGTPNYFTNNDNVQVDDTAIGTNALNLTANVSPISVLVTNNLKNYTISATGASALTGGMVLTKKGLGLLTFAESNSFTGGVTISGGAVNLQNGYALNGNTVTVNSGTELEVQGNINIAPATLLTLSSSGTNNTGGLRNLSGNNTYGGSITLNAASTRINSDSGTLTLTNGVTGGANLVTLGGSGNIAISTATVSGSGGLVKDGGGTNIWTLNPSITSGGVTVNNGTFQINNGNFGGTFTPLITVNTNGVLWGNGTHSAGGGTALVINRGTWLMSGEDYKQNLTMVDGLIAPGPNPVSSGGELRVGSSGGGGSWTWYVSNSVAGSVINSKLNTIGSGVNLTWNVTRGTAASDLTINGVIFGSGNITFAGNGVSTLSATNTWTGTNLVGAGTLSVSGQLTGGNTNIISDGAVLNLGVVTGRSTITNAASLTFGASGATTLGLQNFVGSTTAPIYVTNLTANGTVTVVVTNSAARNIAVGQWPLIKYTGVIGGAGFGAFTLASLPRGVVAVLVNNTANSSVDLNVIANDQIVWNGTVAGGIWDTNNTTNWSWNGSATTYQEPPLPGDGVLFDDTAAGTTIVTLNQSVTPLVVAFNNTNKNYSLGGTGTINTNLIKNGTGTLTNTLASYAQTLSLNAGAVEMQNGGDVGYTIAAGATLRHGYNNPGGYNKSFTLNGNGVSDPSGLYIKLGTTFSRNAMTIQNAPTAIRTYGSGSSATINGFDVNGDQLTVAAAASGSTVDSAINFSSGSYGYALNIASGANNATGDLVINGLFVGGGAAQVRGENQANGLHKFGNGSLLLTGVSTFSSGTAINGGSVILSGGNNRLPATTSVALGNGSASGQLVLAGVNQTIAGLVVNGTGTTNAVVGGSATASILTITNTTPDTNACVLGGAGANQNNLALTMSGTSTLLLSAANTYTGNTTINGGTLALAATGSISNSANISIAAGATLDVSANSAYTLSSSNTLNAAGAASAASIIGANGGTVSLGSQPVVLTYDGTHPALTIAQGTLVLNGNAFTVNSASSLTAGSYTLVSQSSGSITSAGTCSVTGTAIGAGTIGTISVSGGSVVLTIQNITGTTLVLAAGSNPSTYGAVLTFQATISPAPATVGETITFMDGAATIGTGTNNAGGVATFATSALVAGAHSITAVYPGDANNLPSTNTPALSQNVNSTLLTITANNTNKVYDGIVFSGGNGVTYAGFVNGETNTVLGGTLSYSGTAQGVAAAGSYTIIPSGLTNAFGTNYAVSYVNGTLTISQAPSAISLVSSDNPSGYHDSVFFTVAGLAADASGSVTFLTNGSALSTSNLVSGTASSLAFTNLLRGNTTVTVAYAGDGNYLGSTNSMTQTVTNHPPAANVMTVTRTAGLALLIKLSDVATNWSDVDGDSVELSGVTMQSTNGINLFPLNWSTNLDGSIVTTNAYAYLGYTNSPNVADQISYRITDGQGGTNIGYVNIVIHNNVTGTNSITAIDFSSPYSNSVTAYGIPSYFYTLQRATNLISPMWVDVQTNQAVTNGVINSADTFWDLGGVKPSPSAFYQLKWQP